MTGFVPDGPFIIFDDPRAAAHGKARLYANPVEIVTTDTPADVQSCLDRLRAGLAQGLHVAGYVAYETGHALEPKLATLAHDHHGPLLWFGLFANVDCTHTFESLLPDPASAWTGAPRPAAGFAEYAEAIARVKSYIAAGDIYQANYTFPATVPTAGHPLAIYARLRAASGSGWGGVIHHDGRWLLSASPELFFTLEKGVLTARPMKGTSARHSQPDADDAAAQHLHDDEKQRAENLMIVDLLRNDLSRLSRPGSVRVPDMFTIERYPTVYQMTSTVTAELATGHDAVDVLGKIFPCGSVTGAPKIRAMEIIHDIETSSRGAYTGSMGWIDAVGNAAFNVAIRTLELHEGATEARLGLGSGIVADSEVNLEWAECLAKGAFVTAAGQAFDLLETMRFDAQDGLCDLERHLARMKASATALGFVFDRHSARNDLQAATFRLRTDSRVRMRLSPTGALAIETSACPADMNEVIKAAIVRRPVPTHDFRLAHKTSDRAFYTAARDAGGTFEVVLVDEDGFVTEGSFTNIFVRRGDVLLTPPHARGLLPGILRDRLIEDGKAIEADLRAEDLSDGFYFGNALRGLMKAQLV